MGLGLLAVGLHPLVNAQSIAPHLLSVALGCSDWGWAQGPTLEATMIIQGLDDFPTALDVLDTPLADGREVLTCTHQPTPGTAEIAYSAVYLVNSAGIATKVGQSEPFGKDTACAVSIRGTTLRLWVTEPPPAGGGAANRVQCYDIQIGVGLGGGGGTIDTVARQLIAGHELRLDRIAAGAAG